MNDVDDATIPSHRPTILSDSIVLNVDNGMTIRLPCLVDILPGNRVTPFNVSLNLLGERNKYCSSSLQSRHLFMSEGQLLIANSLETFKILHQGFCNSCLHSDLKENVASFETQLSPDVTC